MKGKWRMAVISLAAWLLVLAGALTVWWAADNDQDQLWPLAIGVILLYPVTWLAAIGAIRLGYPHSAWALRFYNEANMERARERFRHKLKDPNVIDATIVAIRDRPRLTLTDTCRTLSNWFCMCVGWPIFVVGMILMYVSEFVGFGIAAYCGGGQGFIVLMGWLIGACAVLRVGSFALAGLGAFITGMD
jgi:hypothetical protein